MMTTTKPSPTAALNRYFYEAGIAAHAKLLGATLRLTFDDRADEPGLRRALRRAGLTPDPRAMRNELGDGYRFVLFVEGR